MKKLPLVAALAMSLMLGGCTVDDIKDGMVKACGYLPAEQAVVSIITLVYPAAGLFLTATQVQAVVEAGCKAVEAAKSKKGFMPPANIAAKVTGADGKRYSIPLGGNFVAR